MNSINSKKNHKRYSTYNLKKIKLLVLRGIEKVIMSISLKYINVLHLQQIVKNAF